MLKKLNDICSPVTDKIWIVDNPDNGRYPYCYSFLITGKKNLLLDPNCDIERITALRDFVGIDLVVISHSHMDHMASTWLFKDIPILCPREAPEKISDLDFLAARATGGGREAELWKEYMRTEMKFIPPTPTGFFQDGDFLLIESSMKLKAIYTPGHSIDHYVFFEEESRILFSSDIDFTDFGPWYGYEECSIKAFRKSIQRIRDLPIRILLSSHRSIIMENIQEEIDRFEQGFERHKEKIRYLLRSRKSMALNDLALASPFYKCSYKGDEYLKKIEACMIHHLLNDMIEDGEIAEISAPRHAEEKDLKTVYQLRI